MQSCVVQTQSYSTSKKNTVLYQSTVPRRSHTELQSHTLVPAVKSVSSVPFLSPLPCSCRSTFADRAFVGVLSCLYHDATTATTVTTAICCRS